MNETNNLCDTWALFLQMESLVKSLENKLSDNHPAVKKIKEGLLELETLLRDGKL
jgi:hypothetical protein